MAAGLNVDVERRSESRIGPDRTPWQRLALVRPGQEVEVINVSSGGVLVESASGLKPGVRAELQLFGGVRWQVRGRIARCRVVRLTPLCYEAAIVFDERLDLLPAGVVGG